MTNFVNFWVHTRGPEYSRQQRIIIRANQLVENGAKIIWLLGQNVNAYSMKKKTFRLNT